MGLHHNFFLEQSGIAYDAVSGQLTKRCAMISLLMFDTTTHVRVVGAFQALLVSWRTLLTSLVHGMLG